MGDVGVRAVEAAGEGAVEVEIGRAEEPLAGGDDDVVGFFEFRRPRRIEFVEVEAVGAREIVGIGFLGADEIGGGDDGDVEVVVCVLVESVLVCWA